MFWALGYFADDGRQNGCIGGTPRCLKLGQIGGNAEAFGNWILGRKNVLEVLGFW